jgi:hypothetical protein
MLYEINGRIPRSRFTYRIQVCDSKSSSKKHSKNLSNLKDAMMYYETYIMKARGITRLSDMMQQGNYRYLADNNLVNNARDYFVLLGRYLFQFEKSGIIKADDVPKYINTFENLVIDVEFPDDYYCHRRGPHNQQCLEENDSGATDDAGPFEDNMKRVPVDFIFPTTGQSLASSGLAARMVQPTEFSSSENPQCNDMQLI